MRTKPVFGMIAGALCVTAWIGTTIGDVLHSAEDVAPLEIALSGDVASRLIPSVIGGEDSEEAVMSMTEEAVNLAQSYEVGEATCQDTLARVDECLGALQTEYVTYQSQPYWESSHDQLMSIRGDLPCCGNSTGGFVDGGGILGGSSVNGGFVEGGVVNGGFGGEQFVPGSEQIIGEQVIGEQVIGPVPLDQACLPGGCNHQPAPIGFAGGGFGGGGGVGGGFFGGGRLLGLTGLGIGIAALASNDDDDAPRVTATPTR